MEMFHAEPAGPPDDALSEGAAVDTLPGSGAQLTHRQILMVFGAISLGIIPAVLDGTIVATALPSIAGDLGGTDQISWVVTAYLLAQTIATPLFGKFGDLFGRKLLFQIATATFLAASVLAGLSMSMGMLIGSRVLQGFAGGGLIVLVQAIIADVVSPRERGRYQGYFGAVFGAASIAGPLVGGVLTDAFSWRLIFFINVPFCIAGLIMVGIVVPLSPRRSEVRIDWLGITFLSIAITSLVLLTTWGGVDYAWGSPMTLVLGLLTLAFTVGFLLVERRAQEPAIPLVLFRLRTVRLSSAILFVLGVTMFGTLTFLPTFLQVANGASASSAGILLAPQVVGTIGASVFSGQVLSRTGRYRWLPIVGTAIAAVGMFLLSTLHVGSSFFQAAVYMGVFGIGIGMTMQVLVVATQNEAPVEHLGVATATVNFFRAVGSSIGVAVFGALYTSQLTNALGAGAVGNVTPEGIAALSPGAQEQTTNAVSDAITQVFLFAVPVLLVAFALTWFLREVPLRTSSGAERVANALDIELGGEEALLAYVDPSFAPEPVSLAPDAATASSEHSTVAEPERTP